MENKKHTFNLTQSVIKREPVDRFDCKRPHKKNKYRRGKEKHPKGEVYCYNDVEVSASSMAKYNLPDYQPKRYNKKKGGKGNYFGTGNKFKSKPDKIVPQVKKDGKKKKPLQRILDYY